MGPEDKETNGLWKKVKIGLPELSLKILTRTILLMWGNILHRNFSKFCRNGTKNCKKCCAFFFFFFFNDRFTSVASFLISYAVINSMKKKKKIDRSEIRKKYRPLLFYRPLPNQKCLTYAIFHNRRSTLVTSAG